MKFPISALRNLTLAFGFLSSASFAQAIEITTPKAVIELFTSQGCHACPPADKTFAELIKNDDYLGLAFHVDYWDRLGWKDTFGDKEFTLRQWNYAWAMNLTSAYTPQAVVNGRKQLVGTKDQQIDEWANVYHNALKGMTVPIKVERLKDNLEVSIDSNAEFAGSNLYAVYFEPSSIVKIKKGANRGKTIDYVNIVKKIEFLGATNAEGLKQSMPINNISDFSNMALILQANTPEGMSGPIVGAAVIKDLKSS